MSNEDIANKIADLTVMAIENNRGERYDIAIGATCILSELAVQSIIAGEENSWSERIKHRIEGAVK